MDDGLHVAERINFCHRVSPSPIPRVCIPSTRIKVESASLAAAAIMGQWPTCPLSHEISAMWSPISTVSVEISSLFKIHAAASMCDCGSCGVGGVLWIIAANKRA